MRVKNIALTIGAYVPSALDNLHMIRPTAARQVSFPVPTPSIPILAPENSSQCIEIEYDPWSRRWAIWFDKTMVLIDHADYIQRPHRNRIHRALVDAGVPDGLPHYIGLYLNYAERLGLPRPTYITIDGYRFWCNPIVEAEMVNDNTLYTIMLSFVDRLPRHYSCLISPNLIRLRGIDMTLPLMREWRSHIYAELGQAVAEWVTQCLQLFLRQEGRESVTTPVVTGNDVSALTRATELLREHLTSDQWASWQNSGEFDVIVTHNGHQRRFVVPGSGMVREYDNENRCLAKYCLVSVEDGIPYPDVALARKVMLECDFARFMEKANGSIEWHNFSPLQFPIRETISAETSRTNAGHLFTANALSVSQWTFEERARPPRIDMTWLGYDNATPPDQPGSTQEPETSGAHRSI